MRDNSSKQGCFTRTTTLRNDHHISFANTSMSSIPCTNQTNEKQMEASNFVRGLNRGRMDYAH
jgi:hypothetical protein